MTKVVLVIPPIEDFYSTFHRFSKLGVIATEKALFNNKIDYIKLDFLTNKQTDCFIPQELDYLKEYIIEDDESPISFWRKYHHYGNNEEYCVKKILSIESEFILISCFAFAYSDTILRIAEKIKAKKPTAKIILGGAGSAIIKNFFLKTALFFDVLEGDAEISIKNFIIKQKCDNNYAKEISHVFSIKDSKKRVRVDVMLTRGCKMRCAFCANRLTSGENFRQCNKENFLDDFFKQLNLIDLSNKELEINFEDDNLLLDKVYFFDILERIKEKYSFAIFLAENGLDYRLCKNEDAIKLIKLGFNQFNFSAAVTKNLEEQNRDIDKNRLIELTSLIEKNGKKTIIYFICGFKTDDLFTICDFILFLHKLPVLIGISPFYAVPKISGFEDEEFWTRDKIVLTRGSSCYPWNKSLTTKDLVTFFRIVRFLNFLKIENKSSIEIELVSTIIKTKSLHFIKNNRVEKIENLNNSIISKILENI